MTEVKKDLARLFERWSGGQPLDLLPLPGSGSYRRYYRILGKQHRAVGAFNEEPRENHAFFTFTGHFLGLGLPVPQVLARDEKKHVYLLTDLGDTTLFSLLDRARKDTREIPEEIIGLYKEVIAWLPRFQVVAGRDLDYSACYPRAAFDRQSMMWDLNYFKYYFLKLAKIPFDEQLLEDDFRRLADLLLEPDASRFMYRDFQSRNIMIDGGRPSFIDYQGGRKGPLQYDIASLLYDAKAAIPPATREMLLNVYLDELRKQVAVDEDSFLRYYDGFVLIRILQALGAYGFRGYYENKPHFLKSIPFAMENIEYLLEHHKIPANLPVLSALLEKMTGNPGFRKIKRPEGRLRVRIFSFSYREPLPRDDTGHGGGFVFDCRALPNPGRYAEYQDHSGLDRPVADFMRKEPEVDEFLSAVFRLVDRSVGRYLERDFTDLMVSFGCTGGRHRSVYCAEELARHLEETWSVRVTVHHTALAGKKI